MASRVPGADDELGGLGTSDAERLRLLTAVITSGNDAVVVAELDSVGDPTVVYVNDRFADQSGYERHEIVGRNPEALLAPANADEARLHLRRAAQTGLATTVEARLVRKDGSTYWVDSSVTPVPDDRGVISHLVAIHRDVSERHRVEAHLRESEAKFRRAFDDAAIGVAIIEQGGTVVHVNPALCRLLGWRASELVTKTIADVVHPDDEAKAIEVGAALLSGQAPPDQVELRLHHRSGAVRTCLVSVSVLTVADSPNPQFIVQVQDVTSRRAAEDRLAHDALHDPLTGLPNRLLLRDRLENAIEQTRRAGSPTGVLFIDLDRFKVINDGMGHAAGDLLLSTIGDRLRHAVRPTDTVARFGGDEFVVVCGALEHVEDVVDIAERVLSALRRPVALAHGEARVTASVGIAIAGGGSIGAVSEAEPELLLRDAGAAMVKAKERGRDAWAMFDAALLAEVEDRLSVEQSLHVALERGELEVHYQSQVELATGRIAGAEALIRWRHPERGLTGPGAFIGVAEDTGLIVPIGAWVLAEACRMTAHWRANGSPDFRVAVNVSARQLADPQLIDHVVAALEGSGIEPSALEVELTESVFVADFDGAVETLSALRGLGVRLALDDFGTGYSSLALLKQLPFDVVKIDRGFINDIHRDAKDHAIVAAILGLSGPLGLEVVAEGIETLDHLAALLDLRCPFGQGYLFARPVPAEELALV